MAATGGWLLSFVAREGVAAVFGPDVDEQDALDELERNRERLYCFGCGLVRVEGE